MNRFTKKDVGGRWSVEGLPWDNIHAGSVITKVESEILYGCLCKLKDYEDTGLNPDEMKCLQYKAEELNPFIKSQIARLVIKHRWIPVEEKLPETDGDYLVTIEIPEYNRGKSVTNWLSWGKEEKVWTEINEDPVIEKISAWMRIPDPYDEDTENE